MIFRALTGVALVLLLTPMGALGQASPAEANWVPFEQIEKSDGALDITVLEDIHRIGLERAAMARTRDGHRIQKSTGQPDCVEMHYFFEPLEGSRSTFAAQVDAAHTVVRGIVQTTAQGFYYGQAGMSLGVEVRDIVKQEPTQPIPSVIRVFYPWAEYTVEGTRFCTRGYHENLRPEIGQEVFLVLLNAQVSEAEGLAPITMLLEEEIVFGLPNGEVSVPYAYRADADLESGLSFEELGRWIEQRVGSENHGDLKP